MASAKPQILFCCVTYGEVILVTHQIEPENFTCYISTILPLIPKVPGERKLTFPVERFQVHVFAEESGLTYCCITDPTDQHLFPFTFLDTIKTKFTEISSLTEKAPTANENEFQNDFAPVLAAVVFNFNIGQGDKLTVLETQIHDVKKIILNNVEKLIERGEKLEDLVTKSENLTVKSGDFRQASRSVARQQRCKNWKMWLIIGSLLGTVLVVAMLISTGTIRLN
ncbi:hypothetical protein R5R35_002132 [Gryllus longicercus]|uniref:Vesicle-associated membrane protein 7 n=1 Tax=Gryllus longicercus TaxID=2509291 RepID=A0AAN9Z9Y1_9ORTH